MENYPMLGKLQLRDTRILVKTEKGSMISPLFH
jgi:hypothetical protein